MRRSGAWRTGIVASLTIPLILYGQVAAPTGRAAAATAGGLSAAEVQRLAQNATERVIVILRDQHRDLVARGATRATRLATVATEQAPLLSELTSVHASHMRSFHLVNAIAATVSAAEAARLRANPAVQAVVPDLAVHRPAPERELPAATPGRTPSSALPPCTLNPTLEPEALQLTNTAFTDAAIPQAQRLVTGQGVTVAFIADGLDIHNPDFVRPDGTPVFVDYQDFSGDGPNAPTNGAEAFGDASSIAAQGNETYNVNDFVNVAHKRPVACPQIKILGMAPGASLIGLKIINGAGAGFTSPFLQAIEYAVDHGADVLNESLGENNYPDNATDPISLANAAAVAAGVTVVASTGDAGTNGTIGSPATDPNVIAAGGSTQFRLYAQTVRSGIQLGSGGYVSNNISSLSSGGPTQSGQKTIDVVAPADLGWALCSTDQATYQGCADDNGNPSPIQEFGGTSEAAPLTAGEAALVIQAYRQSHGGASPTPALVKQIIKSTATDLGYPSYEQGAGLIDSLRAVQAALSVHDAVGTPARQGDALLTTPDQFAATAGPNTLQAFPFQVSNVGTGVHVVRPLLRTLAPPFARASYTLTLDPATDPTFVDQIGATRAYVAHDIVVPAGAQRLDAAISWDVVTQPNTRVRLILFDPQGRLVAFSIPQGTGQGYGHVDARFPTAGTWRAVAWTPANAAGYAGVVHLDVAFSRFTLAGIVIPATRTVLPGQSGTFTAYVRAPAQPGDLSAEVAINGAGAIPLVLRTLVPLGPTGGTFFGLLTGGNGRAFSPGQVLTYQFDVPAGLHDLGLSLAIADTNYNLEGVLVDPAGLPLDVQSTVTALDPASGQPTAYTNALQLFRRDPQAGRWKFILLINLSISGQQTALAFGARIAFNTVQVQAPGLPNDPTTTLAAGTPVVVPIRVTNTGIVTKDIFVDPRLAQSALLSLGGTQVTLPFPPGAAQPTFFVPPESSQLTVAAESMTPTVPISMDIYDTNGAPPFGMPGPGGPGSPDVEALSFVDPFNQAYAVAASFGAPEVPAGLWVAQPTEVGPYATPAPPTMVQLGAVAVAQPFDAAVRSSTGDAYAVLTGRAPSGSYTPLSLAPGASGTTDVTITPTAAPGTPVQGVLYVDTLASSGGIPITGSGDELIALPYSYTVGSAPAPTK